MIDISSAHTANMHKGTHLESSVGAVCAARLLSDADLFFELRLFLRSQSDVSSLFVRFVLDLADFSAERRDECSCFLSSCDFDELAVE